MERNKLSIKNRWLENVCKNNPTIALNILYIKEKEICSIYISKNDSNCEKQRILNDPKWRKIL